MQNCLSFAKLVKYIENYSFDEFFNSGTVDDFIDYLYENSEEYQMGEWRCTYGATKLVIIMEKEDFVFKIPFNSEWDSGKGDYAFFCGANTQLKLIQFIALRMEFVFIFNLNVLCTANIKQLQKGIEEYLVNGSNTVFLLMIHNG